MPEIKEVSREEMREMFSELDKSNLTAKTMSEVAFPSVGERCEDATHDHCAIGCMWHDYEHVVGGMCLDCHKQWFFEADWSSPECRAARNA